MNILLLGSGGREHAFAHFISKSTQCEQLFIAPGNAGTAACGTNVPLDLNDFDVLWDFCVRESITLLVPGNEDPLVAGITDFIEQKSKDNTWKVGVAGPSKYAAQLEGSKDFSKQFMINANIPTAAYQTFDAENVSEGFAFIDSLQPPYVLKADGLAAGKGVIITNDADEAKNVLGEMIVGQKFGKSSEKVVIEEFLDGIEISVFVVSDGVNYKILGSAKDYKRIGEGDTGLNTGGMGAISPVPFADAEFMEKVERQIIQPTLNRLRDSGHPYKGFLFLGLMNVGGDPKVIEYNVRMGDPETEAIFPRLQTDMVDLLQGIASGTLNAIEFELNSHTAATVFVVSKGYPGDVLKGLPITMNIDHLPEGAFVFHAGVARKEGKLVTNGGRVSAVTVLDSSLPIALQKALELAKNIQFEGAYFRSDIGLDLLKYGK